MKKIRLRTFIILSLALHTVLISALVLVFLPRRRILRIARAPISVGFLTQENGIDKAEEKNLESFASHVSRHQETQKKTPPDKMAISQGLENRKMVNKTRQERESSAVDAYDNYNVKEKINKDDIEIKARAAPESSTADMQRSNERIMISYTHEETNNQRTDRLSGNENINFESGTDSLSENIERAFPDYRINPKPKYPMLARRKGYEGTILLRVLVLESGGVGKVKLEKSSGYEILDESALKAVQDWVFVPGKKNGEPISSWVTVPIKFRLNRG